MKNFFKKERKPKYLKFDNYWVQKIETSAIQNRVSYFEELYLNKTVIHFGCTDWPIFDSNNNLHIKLSKHAKVLHGFDIDKEGIENLKKFVNQEYFSAFSEIPDIEYDICLVPETIEHVDNVRLFLEELSKVRANTFIITAPNCFSKEHLSRNFYADDYFVEVVHPDHNCWYSPYTLKNQIEKYSSLNVECVKLLEEDKMICCVAKKK
jgi:2-polyprenyl-3-methyl-5-hydroxy-6-metoxy-1,4-benzoquinol methylase